MEYRTENYLGGLKRKNIKVLEWEENGLLAVREIKNTFDSQAKPGKLIFWSERRQTSFLGVCLFVFFETIYFMIRYFHPKIWFSKIKSGYSLSIQLNVFWYLNMPASPTLSSILDFPFLSSVSQVMIFLLAVPKSRSLLLLRFLIKALHPLGGEFSQNSASSFHTCLRWLLFGDFGFGYKWIVHWSTYFGITLYHDNLSRVVVIA